jgi:RNA polymerase sigma-70 factor (ECF subfamily)
MNHGQRKEFVLTDYAKSLIRFKARQLSRRRDFQPAHPEDLEQELWLALVKAAEQFDPAKASLDTFIDRVVNTAVATLVRACQRRKRGNGLMLQSLDGELEPASGTSEPLATAISVDDLARRTGAVPRDETLVREDAEAVEHALAQMPEEMRDLCRRLMGGTVASVARELGVSRRQVRKIIRAARPFFERAGFDPRSAGQIARRRHM